jgi:hypothetical protein
MLGCTEVASVRIEWPVTDGRMSGLYCVGHTFEIARSVARDVTFAEVAQDPGVSAPRRMSSASSFTSVILP